MTKKETINKIKEDLELEQEESKRKRLVELKIKDKIEQLEIELRNFKDKIDFLEKNNLELKNEIDEQERRLARYVNNFLRAKLASEGVRKEGDDEKTSLEKARKRSIANSYYGMDASISGEDVLAKRYIEQIRKIKETNKKGFEDPSQFNSGSSLNDGSVNQIEKFKEKQHIKLQSLKNPNLNVLGECWIKSNEDPNEEDEPWVKVSKEEAEKFISESPWVKANDEAYNQEAKNNVCDDLDLEDFLSPFDRPNSLVDQQVVNETLLGKRDSYNPYKHFMVSSPEREIYFLLHENDIFREYFVVKFGSVKGMYRSKWKHNGGTLGTGKFEEESAISINPYKDNGYPFDFYPAKHGNFIAKNKRILGENFCLYIDFRKWRVSMYRFNKPENAWVIHDFAEVVRYDETPPKGVIL